MTKPEPPEEKEIAWLPKYLAQQVKDLDDEPLIEEIILKYINDYRWEGFQEKISKVKSYSETVVKELQPIKKELDNIKNLMDSINILQFLFTHYKREDIK